MSKQAKRYDTLVIEDSTSKTVPQTVDGARVVSWAAGHAIAESSALEEFVQSVANGDFSDLGPDDLEEAATAALEKAVKQRESGYD